MGLKDGLQSQEPKRDQEKKDQAPKKPDGFSKKYYPSRSMLNPLVLAHIKAKRR